MQHLPAHLLLVSALGATAWSLVGAWRWWRGRAGSRAAAAGAWLAAGLLVAAFGVLIAAFLGDDFRCQAVANHSSRDLPLLYKISASWAGQEGSLLLWCAMGAVLALLLLRLRPQPDPLALAIFQAAQLGLLGITVLQTPFRRLSPVPPDGQGLNPLLQDPWMAAHPPVVFLGYAAAALPFALALAALCRRERDGWVGPALRFTLVTVLTLGAGILLGAFWAYEVLGWGGYWGWDPVENSSLIPWLTAVALLHGLLVQRKTGALARSNAGLALGTFALVIYATFLTRSGVLSSVSVHSFPQGGILAPLLAYLAAIAVAPAALLAWRRRAFAGERLSVRLDLATMLAASTGLILVSAGIILAGTSWPMISMWFGEPASPKPAFYNQANLPVWVLVAAILVAAPLLAWRAIPLPRLLRVSIVPVTTGAAAAGWAWLAGMRQPLFLALILFSGAALGSCLVRAARVARASPLRVGAPLAHAGMALLLVGVIVSSAGERREEARLPRGEDRVVLGRTLRFEGPDGGGPGDAFRVLLDPDGAATSARLELVEVRGDQVQRKPAILRRARGDLYLSPIGVERAPRLARRALLRQGQPVEVEGRTMTFEAFTRGEHGEGMSVGARLRLAGGVVVEPALHMTAEGPVAEPVALEGGARVRLVAMRVEAREVLLEVQPAGAPTLLHVEASWKPGMNVLWAGSILLCLGTGMSLARRLLRVGAESLEPAPEPARGRRARGSAVAHLRPAGSRQG